MNKILVPVDGSSHALKALQIACDLADKYGGEIILLHVLARNRRADDLLNLLVHQNLGPQLVAALRAAADKPPGTVSDRLARAIGDNILGYAAGRVRRRGLEPEVLEIDAGDPAECILIAHKRTGASMIVMGCRGASPSDASSFGSVSHAVFEKAECTCLAVK